MTTKLPRLLNGSMKEVAQLHPDKLSVELDSVSMHNASMTLPDDDPDVSVGDWIDVYLPCDKHAGIMRVSAMQTDYISRKRVLTLEHGIVTMGEMIVPGKHEFAGWDDGNPDVVISGHRVTIDVPSGTSSEEGTYYFARASVIFKNSSDGSDVTLMFPPGIILPIIRLTDNGYRVPVNEDIVAAAEMILGEWDQNETIGLCGSSSLMEITRYSDAHGTLVRSSRLYYTDSIFYPTNSYVAGTRVTVYGKTESNYYAYENTFQYDLYAVKLENGLTGLMMADDIELDPGYSIETDTERNENQFKKVANVMIGYARSHYKGLKWEFGESDFEESFGYAFENVNLLTAILMLPEKLREPYKWEYDQSGERWRLNLRRLDKNNIAELRINRNISRIQISLNAQNIVTCVYPIGKDGLNIKKVNDGNPYLTSNNDNVYWHAEKFQTFDSETASGLKESALTYLQKNSEPSVSINISAIELANMTGEPLDSFDIGKVCRVVLPQYGLTLNEYITHMKYNDVYGEPNSVEITLANHKETVADMISVLMKGR